MNFQDLNGRALSWGVGLYIALYVMHLFVLPLLIGKEAASSESQGLLFALNQILGLATCLVPGYLAGRMAGRQGYLHGGIVGGVSTVITALMAMLWAVMTNAHFYGLDTLPFWIMVNVFLGAVAGIYATNLEEPDNRNPARVRARDI